jgi:hypothetical protein
MGYRNGKTYILSDGQDAIKALYNYQLISKMVLSYHLFLAKLA